MTSFIIVGLLFTITGGAMFGLMFTCDMRDNWKRAVVATLIALVVGFGISGLLTLEYKNDETVFNNGYCQCGGEWELFDVERHRNAGSDFWYKCNGCKNVIMTNHQF